MNVIDGLRIVQRYFPGAKIGFPEYQDDNRIAYKLNALSIKDEPETYKDFIALMDELGLSVVKNEVVLY